MKKLCLSFGVLCAACLLFCGTAMAAEPEVAAEYADGTITVQETPKGTDRAYTVSRNKGAEAGQLYLALLLKGAGGDTTSTEPLPTKDNVYYMDVKAAEGTSVTFDVYPKAMEDGTYIVYLSDYSGGNAGAAKVVAKIVIDGGDGGTTMIGDVTGDGNINASDLLAIISHMTNGTDINIDVADVTNDGIINASDLLSIISYMINGTAFARS